MFTGLLANGGGFLLVPVYLLVFGLRMRQAVGTSLVVIAVLAMPTLAVPWALGHINWPLAGEFALGLLPGVWRGAGWRTGCRNRCCGRRLAGFWSPSGLSSPSTG